MSGATYFKTSGEDFVFSIYRGDDFASLELLQSDRSSYIENAFHAIAGETYYLQMVATPPRRSNNFSFSLTQSPESAPPNDLFANATPLAGENFTLQLNGAGSTAEFGEPSDFKRSIWYSWQAPSAGVYQLTQYPPNIGIFRGESLDTLVRVAGGSPDFIEANEGEEFKIAFEDDPGFRNIALSLQKVSPPENDAFANPVKLGASEEISLEINQTQSTFEPGEPEPRDSYVDSSGGSVWLEWIAPRSGLVSLSDSSLVYTGDHLANLKLLNNLSSAQFQAIQGMTYRIAMIQKSGSFWPVSSIFRLTMATMPNDDFDDRTIIPSELPYSWEGTLTNATFELSHFKFNDGDAWWEWTAPRDGQIFMMWNGGELLPYRVSDYGIHGVSRNSLTEVRSGETFVFQFNGKQFEQMSFSLQYAEPSPSGGSSEEAQVIETFAEPFPVVHSENGQGKHWYRWTAESSNTISFEGVGGREIFANLYTVDSSNTNGLSSVAPQNPDDWSSPVWTRFEIIAGRQYWLAMATSSSYHHGGYSWRAVFGPPGDRFAGAPALPAIAPITWNGSTTRAGREEGEPGIGGTFPDRTVWRTWTAPDSGFYSFRNDRFQTAIFFGERIDALKILAEGHQGTFYATRGTKYRIVVNSFVTEDSFTFTIAPEDSPYERWRQSFFGQTLTPEGATNADPDFDGRPNLIEMAFGSDPSQNDGPLNLWTEQIADGLLLSIRRPTGIQNFEFFFEISKDLNNWQSTLDLDSEPSIEPSAEGQEIFRVLVKNPEWNQQPGLFLRLLVRQGL